MRLLSSVDTEGKFFWIQSQFMGRHKHRNIKSCDEIVYARLCKRSRPRIIAKNWPTILADEIETELILIAWGYQINHRNHFNFEIGEQFSVQKRNPITSKVTAPLLIIGVLTLEQRISVGLSRDLSEKEYIIDTGESYTGEVIDYSEIEKAIADVGEARAEAERRKRKNFFKSLS